MKYIGEKKYYFLPIPFLNQYYKKDICKCSKLFCSEHKTHNIHNLYVQTKIDGP